MIGERLTAIAVQRERLRLRADGQRQAISASMRGLDVPLRIIDGTAGGVRWLRLNPAAAIAALVAIALVRPRGVATLAQGGLRLWAVWRALRAPSARVVWALLPRFLDIYRGWRGSR